MSAARGPIFAAIVFGVVLTGAMASSAQASLRHAGKMVHSTTPQHLTPLVRSARQSKVKPVLANTRTMGKTLTLRRQPPR
jgi:hypothetical protein